MLWFCLFGGIPVFTAAAPLVTIGNTAIVGTTTSNQEFFGGIPFAEPPLGDLRFSPPVLKLRLNVSSFDASHYGPACLQPASANSVPLSEDCLTINILRPAGVNETSLLPVMAWIYGGGFLIGASSDPSYNGSPIVSRSVERGTPVIFVSFNYRLGPLGFPQGEEVARKGLLNLGLKDQLVALEWIQHNIAAFGGDRGKVTAFGESAGAASLGVHLFNSDIHKFARAAILESGTSTITAPFFPTEPRGVIPWNAFVNAVPGCKDLPGDVLPCLRNASTSSLLNAYPPFAPEDDFAFTETIDGPGGLLPDFPSRLYKKINPGQIPVLTGTNLDEGSFIIPIYINSTADIKRRLTASYSPSPRGADALERAIDGLLQLYPNDPAVGSPYNTGNETFGLNSQFKRMASIIGDLMWDAPRRALMEVIAKNKGVLYGYRFSDPQTNHSLPWDPTQPIPPYWGVQHGADVPYVFGRITQPESSKHLSTQIMDYWLSFAASLDPNDGKGGPRPLWPQYTTNAPFLLELNGTHSEPLEDNYRRKQIAFINRDPIVFHH